MTREAFVAELGFALDPFQVQALEALDAGHSVLVAAPTGSGKTIVAEYAVALALESGTKAFYTTPLKALSNQKFGDLAARYGTDRVGLLTGDNAINGEAPIVVMTTEVLRNMIYAASSSLDGLRYVILDEVHYLQNPYRGAVWEEVIVHLPPEVDLVCLSATVSNAEEFADWVGTVRGATDAVIEEKRPIELQHLYLVGDRSNQELLLLPTFVDGHPNPEAAAIDARGGAGQGGRYGSPHRRGRLFTPRRAEVVDLLASEGMLPAIYFIFSRAACDDAVRQYLDFGVRLTTVEERQRIRAIAEAKVDNLSDADLGVLRYGPWLAGLENGVAAHHAGMVPAFKEAVEACFAAALVKVVFATETLSLGINMPARSVVIEKLTKFTGERHEFLTPGEYTQLTGRAGRRGIDEVGHAVVLWNPYASFDRVAGLASTRSYRLTSSFRPTYNMAANLIRRYSPETAHHLLNLSFAQYQTDSQVVREERALERATTELARARAEAECELGDVSELRRLRPAKGETNTDVAGAMAKIRPGDIIVIPGGKNAGRGLVLSTQHRKEWDLRLKVLTLEHHVLLLGPRDFIVAPHTVGQVDLPIPFAPNNRGFQRKAVELLRHARVKESPPQAAAAGGAGPGHPAAACPDLDRHLRALDRATKLEREAKRLERLIRGRAESLARQFDRVLRLLDHWGYVDGWSLTEAGGILARVYHEADLLVAECLRSGLLDDLDVPTVAGLASAFTYEARGPEGGPEPQLPDRTARERWAHIEHVAHELNLAEEEAGLPATRPPDAGFFALAYGWAAGRELAGLLGDQMTGGDFVRNIKQLIDLLRQMGDVAPDPVTRRQARQAADALFRDVVASSSVVGDPVVGTVVGETVVGETVVGEATERA
ncbi:MAG: ATP-dependent helicase HelY [Actinomycetota bacterium]|jgi:ATP-dependent RNA helicase HelY|nr:ATP-dependent helicase HelY [Actinomycetota bacterium]